jgi:hypothetical protein
VEHHTGSRGRDAQAFELPARGTINYKYVRVTTNFPDDMWVSAAEMRPGNAKVLHHGKV